MIKLIVGWKDPQDPGQFDEHYAAVHAPLAGKLPGLREMNVLRPVAPDSSPYRLVAELLFDSEEAMQAAMQSDAGRAAAADGPNLKATAVSWTSRVETIVARAQAVAGPQRQRRGERRKHLGSRNAGELLDAPGIVEDSLPSLANLPPTPRALIEPWAESIIGWVLVSGVGSDPSHVSTQPELIFPTRFAEGLAFANVTSRRLRRSEMI